MKANFSHLPKLLVFAGRKGGHKGRVRQYTSPEEIDAQLQAEKQKANVSTCLSAPVVQYVMLPCFWLLGQTGKDYCSPRDVTREGWEGHQMACMSPGAASHSYRGVGL